MARDHKGKETFIDKVYITKDNLTHSQIIWRNKERLFEYLWDFAVKGIVELNVQKDENNKEVMHVGFTGVNK